MTSAPSVAQAQYACMPRGCPAALHARVVTAPAGVCAGSGAGPAGVVWECGIALAEYLARHCDPGGWEGLSPCLCARMVLSTASTECCRSGPAK